MQALAEAARELLNTTAQDNLAGVVHIQELNMTHASCRDGASKAARESWPRKVKIYMGEAEDETKRRFGALCSPELAPFFLPPTEIPALETLEEVHALRQDRDDGVGAYLGGRFKAHIDKFRQGKHGAEEVETSLVVRASGEVKVVFFFNRPTRPRPPKGALVG